MLISIRYNFRNPPRWARPSAWLYNRVLDQIEWADKAGFDRITLPEHHFLDEAFLPGVLVVAAAVAARTKSVLIDTEILLAPLHHPVRLAEDAALVDILSNGRFAMTVAAGYRPEEYEGLGMKLSERGGRMEECLQILKKCWTEEEFSWDGKYYQLKNVRMTPKPAQPGGPKVFLGGGSEPVARRAAHLADGMQPMVPSMWDAYFDELEKLGRPAERRPIPPRPPPYVHVTETPERDWEILRPHALYEMEQYQAWGMMKSSSYGEGQVSDEQLRKSHAIWTPEQAKEVLLQRQKDWPDSIFSFAPILAGQDPEMAQSSLELIATHVLPELHALRGGHEQRAQAHTLAR